ncbi:fasciclin-like arabinogalactan protein 8 [Nymphaea colorata]|uniref:FAS1 domain-containing protein n=1 Tax=Nymphaea colorata TaxID=210225 RepID=A0A5K0WT14_9MAGN|nr:fasciclin-like arabinogalactan protein 8 [Nymphaea colorata]
MACRLSLMIVLVAAAVAAVAGHNITEMLASSPEYSLYNDALTRTKLADEINSRTTITVLVLPNAVMSSLLAKNPLPVVKNVLSLLVLLDYYDEKKLHDISKGTTLSTTVYQTTGQPEGNLGFVNITDLRGGKVGFGSAAPGSPLDSTFTKSVKQIPYNISVLEVSAPIIAPGVLSAPAPSAADLNITTLLVKAGCKMFADMLASTGVLKTYQSAAAKGLTLFAPSDDAFKGAGVPDFSKLTSAELVSLLEYHAVAEYKPIGSLKTTSGNITTLATSGAGKYGLTVSSAGDAVTLSTGVDSSRISGTVVDDTPLVIFTVDKILLPVELFAATPAPAPSPSSAPSPSPASASAPAPESASAPASVASPPAPPAGPAEAPAASSPEISSNGTSANASSSPLAHAVPRLVLAGSILSALASLL